MGETPRLTKGQNILATLLVASREVRFVSSPKVPGKPLLQATEDAPGMIECPNSVHRCIDPNKFVLEYW